MAAAPVNYDTVSNFLIKLSRNEVPLNLCDMTKNIKLLQGTLLPHDSASPSEVIIGKLVSQNSRIPVAIKFFTKPDPSDENYNDLLGLEYEVKIYRFILDNIISRNLSPNFVAFLAYGECDQFNVAASNKGRPSLVNMKDARILVTENVGSGARFGLSQIFSSHKLHNIWPMLNTEERKKIMFQLVYSVAVMQYFEIVNNDMHAGNIFVVDYKRPLELYYNFKGVVYRIVTQFVLMIFDWDFAYCKHLGKNPKVNQDFLEERLVATNEFNKVKDLYTVFCTLNFEPPIADIYKKKDRQVAIREGSQDKRIYRISHNVARKIAEKVPIKFFYQNEIDDDDTPKTRERKQREIIHVYSVNKKEINLLDVPKSVKKVLINRFGGDVIFILRPEIYGNNTGPYIIEIYKGFRCRLPRDTGTLPGPLILLESKFNEFRVDRAPPDAQHVYYFPVNEGLMSRKDKHSSEKHRPRPY